MNIHPMTTDDNLNLVGRLNVLVTNAECAKALQEGNLRTNRALFQVLNNLTLSKPNWRFKVSDSSTNSSNKRIITRFTISEEGETLGSVGIQYKGRSYKVVVTNARIDAKRERGSGYWTEDPVKAELAIRKNFFRLDKSERLDKAKDAAATLINREVNNKQYALRNCEHMVYGDSDNFVKAHLHEYLSEFPSRKTYFDQAKVAADEAEVVGIVKDLFDKGQAALVVLDGTHYIVQGSETKTYDDSTLPYDLRKKVGMLKLVNDGQMVSGVGCRVDAHTFVTMPESKEDQTEKEQE